MQTRRRPKIAHKRNIVFALESGFTIVPANIKATIACIVATSSDSRHRSLSPSMVTVVLLLILRTRSTTISNPIMPVLINQVV